MDDREEVDESTLKLVKIQSSIRLSQAIFNQLDQLKELRSAYSRNTLIEKILEVVVPRIIERYKFDRSIKLDGLEIFL